MLGEYKIQKGKGPHDHNGLNSIYAKLGKTNFWHVRVGVDNRSAGFSNKLRSFIFRGSKMRRTSGEKYVLQDFANEELEVIDSVTDKIVNELINELTKKQRTNKR